MITSQKIAVITYDYPHRKTQDVVFGLKANAYQNVTLYALPFVKRENPFKPLYHHRPSSCHPIYPTALANNFGYTCHKVEVTDLEDIFNESQPDCILIAGAGLLPASLVTHHKLINSHPAYLPEVRGLDALKWAIYNLQPIGVTTHFVDDKADAGFLIDRKIMEVYAHDTFHSLAYRQYQLEIDMLLEAITLVKQKNLFPPLEAKGISNRRMPKSKEKDLLKLFENYKKHFNSKD